MLTPSFTFSGTDMIPWLGKMHQLGPKDEYFSFMSTGNMTSSAIPTFPVKPSEKRSYGANPTVWLTADEGLYSDVQKLLRHAKKMPDKTAQFYKVCNTITIRCSSSSVNYKLLHFTKKKLCCVNHRN